MSRALGAAARRGAGVAMISRVPLLLVCLVSGPAVAQDGLPDHDTCMALAVAHFEGDLARSRNQASEPNFDIVSRDRVEYCGTLAIVACDRTQAPLVCQADLAAEQEATRDAILATVPAPADVAGLDPIWSDGLYPQLWAVAHGTSAGPDCDGADAAYRAWCVTRQASLKLGEAVALWQVARLLGMAGSAVEAGWAAVPPPPMPVPRPGGDQ